MPAMPLREENNFTCNTRDKECYAKTFSINNITKGKKILFECQPKCSADVKRKRVNLGCGEMAG